jgi:hypothetical protein
VAILVYSSKSFSKRFATQRYVNGVVFEAAIDADAFEDFVVAIACVATSKSRRNPWEYRGLSAGWWVWFGVVPICF